MHLQTEGRSCGQANSGSSSRLRGGRHEVGGRTDEDRTTVWSLTDAGSARWRLRAAAWCSVCIIRRVCVPVRLLWVAARLLPPAVWRCCRPMAPNTSATLHTVLSCEILLRAS